MKAILSIRFALAISLITALLVLSGCTHYYYAPNMQNVPVFQQKGESRINLALSTGDEWSGFELQGAHAFTNRVGGVFNFVTGGGDDDEYGSGHGTMLEGGAGYFYPAGKHFVFETYGQLGYGGIKNLYTNNSSSYSNVDFFRFSVQPAVGFRNSIVEFIFSARLASLNYLSIKQSYVGDSFELKNLDYIHDHSSSLLAEPAATLRLGYKYIKLQLQVGGSFNLTAPDLQQENANVNFGLAFTIPPPKKTSTD